MNTVRILRSLPALVFTWLAVLSLQVAQPGGLVHHWEHALAPESAHEHALSAGAASALEQAECLASVDTHAGHESAAGDAHLHGHGDCAHPASTPDASHDGLCNLCAHFAFLGGLQSAQSGIPAVAVAHTLPVAAQLHLPPLRMARERYAARAPPTLLS